MEVTISACTTPKSLSLFERIPEQIHKEDPYYVPPFPGTVKKLIGKKSVFQRLHGDVIPLIAYREGKAIGRIAAIVNRSHNKHHKDKVGFFGFFDSIEDPTVAEALFQAARSELKKRGLTTMRGPYSPSQADELGLLVEGFETAPFVMMPYNPPYYLDLYEKIGLERAMDVHAFYVSGQETAPPRVEKIINRVRKNSGVTLRNISLKNLSEELKIIRELYNWTLCRNWGFVPITMEDLEAAAVELKAIAKPEMLLIAEKDGKAIGYCLTLPNINEFLWKTRRSSRLMRIIKFVWMLKTQHPKEARVTAMGIHPDYRNTGLAALFYYETLVRGKKQYVGGELSWVEETNKELIKSIQVMGGKQYKTYRLFEQTLH